MEVPRGGEVAKLGARRGHMAETGLARRTGVTGGVRLPWREERDRISGDSVNKLKFKIQLCKLHFYPSSWPQMKNF